jgi:folate-binding protein YgfZ
MSACLIGRHGIIRSAFGLGHKIIGDFKRCKLTRSPCCSAIELTMRAQAQSTQIAHETDALIRVQGTDAASFLNAQLTRRVDNLDEGKTALAAWCTAKGRVQALFRVARTVDGYALQLPANMLPLTLPRLRMFVLRSQVQLVEVENPPSPDDGNLLHDILAGVPEIHAETRDAFLPQMLNLDHLGAIDFKKGCYPGQEIVARAQYLGDLKRRMYRFSGKGVEIPKPGAKLAASDGTSGTVISAALDHDETIQLLAVIPLASAQAVWHLGEPSSQGLSLQSLPYAFN